MQRFMDFILALTFFTHFFSYSFNFVLLYLVAQKTVIKRKSYITHMIWVELVLNICQHFSVESALDLDGDKDAILFKSICIFFMSIQLWTVNTIRYIMTFVMATNRFVCIINPSFNKYFAAETITILGVGIWLFSFIASWYLLLMGCYPRFDNSTFILETSCEYLRWPDFVYKSHYLLILTFVLNVMIVVYSKMRRCGCFRVAIARVSVIAANRRTRDETVFVLQSFIVFIFMAYDAVYTSLRKSYEVEFSQLSQNTQILLGWLNIYSANYMNFLIYFLFHKANRILVIRTIFCNSKWIKSKKVLPK